MLPKKTGSQWPMQQPSKPSPQPSGSSRRRIKPDSDSDGELAGTALNPAQVQNSSNSKSPSTALPRRPKTKRERHEHNQKYDLCFRCNLPGHKAREHDLGGRLYLQQPQPGHSSLKRNPGSLNQGVVMASTSQGQRFGVSPPRSNAQSVRKAGSPTQRSPELRSMTEGGEWRALRRIEGDAQRGTESDGKEAKVQRPTPRLRVSKNLADSRKWLSSRPLAILDQAAESVSADMVVVEEKTKGKQMALMDSSEDLLEFECDGQGEQGARTSVHVLRGLDLHLMGPDTNTKLPDEDVGCEGGALLDLNSPAGRQEGSASVDGLVGLDPLPVGLGIADLQGEAVPEENGAERGGEEAVVGAKREEEGMQKAKRQQEQDECEEGEGETVVFRGRNKRKEVKTKRGPEEDDADTWIESSFDVPR